MTPLSEQTATALELARLFRESEAREALLARQARELEAFASTVLHDLKAPLRGIGGFARAFLGDYGAQIDRAGRHSLEMMRTSALRMGELIDDLLRYSRLERRDLTRERVLLQSLVERVLAELEADIRARRITVRMRLAVEAEPEGLREVVANLVGTAVKFSRPPGGAITIESWEEDNTVIPSVADTGIGFDMQYPDRIFQILQRLHRQEDDPGTGVGLAIVRKVADRHGGRAWMTSAAREMEFGQPVAGQKIRQVINARRVVQHTRYSRRAPLGFRVGDSAMATSAVA